MENLKNKKSVPFRIIFIHYISVIFIGTILLLGLVVGIFFIGMASGQILPANYTENQIAMMRQDISTCLILTDEQIPPLCDYAIFSNEGMILSGNLSEMDAKKAWKIIHDESIPVSPTYHYTLIQRNNEICILRYAIIAEFNNPILRDHLPNPEILAILLFVASFLIQVATVAYIFGQKISKKMVSLQNATVKIQNQDLEFDVHSSGIYEIDNALCSINKMKNQLKLSLNQQWELEQTRKEQVSALAHDIKTPLTIIRGNVELLNESLHDKAELEYTKYILNNTIQIEQYIKELVEFSTTHTKQKLHLEKIKSTKFLTKLEEQMKALASKKELNIKITQSKLPKFLYIDKALFYRAIMNVISNAIECTPRYGHVNLLATRTQTNIQFIVTDSGNGFSPIDLKNATKQFYMGDQSRSSNFHHGIGLYITDSIVQQHGGNLLLANDSLLGGGKVTLTILDNDALIS